MENITKEQADIIGEVANICTGTAATALSMIINRSTNITTPLVEVLDKENTLESDNHILVKVPYTSGLDGTNLMVLDVQDALVIASLMMGGDGRNLSNLQLDDLTLSAIAEAMNQMCGSIATSMASLLSRPTDIGFPLINSKDRKTFEIPDELCNGTDIVKVGAEVERRLAELEAEGRAAILIPSPNVAENHQYYNAMELQKAGAAVVIEEKDLTGEKLVQTVSGMLAQPGKLAEMGRNARSLSVDDSLDRIADALLKLVKTP